MQKLKILADGQTLLDGKPLSGDVLNHLGDICELVDGCSLRSFFELLVNYPSLARISPFLPDFLEKYKNWPSSKDPPLGLDYLELTKVMEMIGYPGPPSLEIYTDFRGIFRGQTQEIKSFPVETLLGAPLRLGTLKHKLLGDKFEEMEFQTVYTLFDLVDGIAWQLAFHGSPVECALRR